MPTYKTPDVYVEELSLFPPSVAEVETAIPAFIGYTARATELITDDLLNKPKKISSMVDFELYYGGGPTPDITEVNIDDSNNFVSAVVSNKFYLYDSMRMFYSNGGGDCYIVSVGKYSAAPDNTAIVNGLKVIEKEDEPTILLFPDAVSIASDTNFASVQTAALSQCAALGDRFAVLDTKSDDALGSKFRDGIGINNLKYGAAYTPWLKVSMPKVVTYADVKGKIKRGGAAIASLKSLTAVPEIQAIIDGLDQVYADKDLLDAQTKLLSADANLRTKFSDTVEIFTGSNSNASVKSLFVYLYAIAEQVDDFVAAGAEQLSYATLRNAVQTSITDTFAPAYARLVALEKETGTKIGAAATSGIADLNTILTVGTNWNNAGTTAASNLINNADTADDKRKAAVSQMRSIFDDINKAYSNLLIQAASSYARTLEDSLIATLPLYKNILSGVSNSMTIIPPSGAVAGIYAMVDNARGVWKAPANVSINNVIAPTVTFTISETDNLNVDVNAGKSINAIRAFAGKGTLIWGSRTLAGNDNEWRYVPVRRFFNMVEESIKKSTYWAVFEPNDSRLWVKVRAMIENYLVNKWKEGALAGATPKDAFFVKCGLGITMTAQDVLEGMLNVEIGLAVVRPAEFIVLKFSHKLQVS